MQSGLLKINFDDDMKDIPRYIPGDEYNLNPAKKEQDINAQPATETQLSGQIENKTNTKKSQKDRAEVVKSDEVKTQKPKRLTELLNLISTPLSEFDKKVIWLDMQGASNFITQSSINTASARSGIGKTFFITALALQLLDEGKISKVIHLNFDGNTSIFKSRGQSDKIKHFLSRDKWVHIRPQEVFNLGLNGVDELLDAFIGSSEDLRGNLLIFDSLVNFCPRMNETEAVAKFYTKLRAIADLGAICWINTHNKKGEDIFTGSQMIESLSDVMWNLTADKKETEIIFAFEVKKARDLHQNQAFSLDLKVNAIFPQDFDSVREPSARNKLIVEFKSILTQNPNGITQGELIEQAGRVKTDRLAREILAELDGELWEVKKIGRENLIKPIK